MLQMLKNKGFVGAFSAKCNRKRKAKDDSKVLGLSKWADGTSIHQTEKRAKRAGFDELHVGV